MQRRAWSATGLAVAVLLQRQDCRRLALHSQSHCQSFVELIAHCFQLVMAIDGSNPVSNLDLAKLANVLPIPSLANTAFADALYSQALLDEVRLDLKAKGLIVHTSQSQIEAGGRRRGALRVSQTCAGRRAA